MIPQPNMSAQFGPYGQGPPQGYGAPPGPSPLGQRPPGPPGPGQPAMYQNNGPHPGLGARPPVPNQGGYGGPPNKPGMPPPTNGPRPLGPLGAQGDQYGQNRGVQPPPGAGAPYMNGPPPANASSAPAIQQMTNQMGNMSISGPQQIPMRPPMGPPPPSTGPSQGIPPSTSSLGQPPSMMPPNSMGGIAPVSSGPLRPPGPTTSMSGPPTSMQGPPTSIPYGSMQHPNAPQMAPPPVSMGPPPMSMNMGQPAPPVSSQAGAAGMVPNSMTGQMYGQQPGMPPSSMAGPPQMAGMPPPPPMAGAQGPPQMGAQPPPPQMGGMHPPPPPQMGGMQPPPSPGGQQMGYPGQPQVGGYPAQPGYPAPRSNTPMGQPSQPAQPPRRLDPDQMPSPIQVIEDDKKRCGIYETGQRGSVPPLITTSIIVEDTGICSPRFIRSTMYNIPSTADLLKQSNIPFSLSITPFNRLHPKEKAPPVIDLGELGPVRCNRCKAYMNPYMQFTDGGRRFQCCFCSCATEVPPEYFNHLDHTGRRVDMYDRPELYLGAYDFVATKDYCKNGILPKPPAYIFMIDVSYNSVKSGLLHLMCQELKENILRFLPKEDGAEESEVRVGFVTYAKQLHFYNVKSNLAQPQMMVVSDVDDVFVPLLDGFLVKPSESELVIDSLLEQIPEMFAESKETEIVLGPVIQAGLDALKSAECPGKLYIFHSSLPVAEAPGKLKNRDDRKLLGTKKKKVPTATLR